MMTESVTDSLLVTHSFFTFYILHLIVMFQSVPGVGGEKKEEEGLTREELQEQERLRSVF